MAAPAGNALLSPRVSWKASASTRGAQGCEISLFMHLFVRSISVRVGSHPPTHKIMHKITL